MIRPRLMLVDDDADFCSVFEKALEAYDATIKLTILANGAELLQTLTQVSYRDRPHLIVMDLDMPRMNGIDATKTIRQNEHLRSVPILLLTRSDRPGDVEKAYETGVNAFIMKPFSLSEMRATIKQIADYWLRMGQLPGTS